MDFKKKKQLLTKLFNERDTKLETEQSKQKTLAT